MISCAVVFSVGPGMGPAFFEPQRHRGTELHRDDYDVNKNCAPLCPCVSVVQNRARLPLAKRKIHPIQKSISSIPSTA